MPVGVGTCCNGLLSATPPVNHLGNVTPRRPSNLTDNQIMIRQTKRDLGHGSAETCSPRALTRWRNPVGTLWWNPVASWRRIVLELLLPHRAFTHGHVKPSRRPSAFVSRQRFTKPKSLRFEHLPGTCRFAARAAP